MSTSAEFADVQTFKDAMKSVRSDTTDDKYLVVGHVGGGPNQLELISVGKDTSNLANEMDDTQVMYALARYETKFDMSVTIKFVFFKWVGDNVPPTKKGRFGVVHGCVAAMFNPYHTLIETSSKEDLDDGKILQQLDETSGTKSKVIENIEGRQERGFTQTSLPKRGPSSTFGVEVPKEGLAVQISDCVYENISNVRDDTSTITWMVASYANSNTKGPVEAFRSGEGGLDEIKACLEPDQAMYALYRVSDVVDDITTVKFVFITWVGTKLKPISRAKTLTHKGTIEQVFKPAHVTIFASDLSDITEKVIMDKVKSASGTASHVK